VAPAPARRQASCRAAELELVFGIDEGQAMVPGRRIALDSEASNVARCARTRQEILRREATMGPNPNHIPGAVPSASALFAPFDVGESLPGVMSIQSPQRDAHGERERLIFRTLCAYGAIGLHNARAYKLLGEPLGALQQAQDELGHKNALLEQAWLQQQQEASFTDPLAHLRNRRFLMAHIEDEVALTLRRFERQQRQSASDPSPDHDLVFYMLDIDHFKSVNDRNGHAAGDAVLVETARRLRSAIRETDFLIRWGGEEFLIVARATNAHEGAVVAERLRAVVAQTPFDVGDDKTLAITGSLGFACLPFHGSNPRRVDWSTITRLADQALYPAKTSGRNCWTGVDARVAPRDREHFERICRDLADRRGGRRGRSAALLAPRHSIARSSSVAASGSPMKYLSSARANTAPASSTSRKRVKQECSFRSSGVPKTACADRSLSPSTSSTRARRRTPRIGCAR
jgi:diguanylate cyclase (GGDEF)-like protein